METGAEEEKAYQLAMTTKLEDKKGEERSKRISRSGPKETALFLDDKLRRRVEELEGENETLRRLASQSVPESTPKEKIVYIRVPSKSKKGKRKDEDVDLEEDYERTANENRQLERENRELKEQNKGLKEAKADALRKLGKALGLRLPWYNNPKKYDLTDQEQEAVQTMVDTGSVRELEGKLGPETAREALSSAFAKKRRVDKGQ